MADPANRMNHYDAIIVGGGPGGTTAGTVLAQGGKRVLILEREKFPRFHIGESLIPYGNEILREIGVWDKIGAAGFMPKLGAEFTLGNSHGAIRFWFGSNLPEKYAKTFQVERSKFDQLLLEHAREAGCEIVNAKAEGLECLPDRVRVRYSHAGETQEATAPWLIDASGRETFIARQLKLTKDDLGFSKKFAIFSHFKNVRRNEGKAAGHISVVRLEGSWLWIIPLDEEKTSVGLVQPLERFKARGETPDAAFERVLAENAELRFRLGKAERVTEYYTTGDYSYRVDQAAGPRWFLVGDAAGFIDPIFSSGVMVAVRTGHLAAKQILKQKNALPLSRWAQRRYTKRVHRMMHVFYDMIRMFYDNRSFEVFMTPVPAMDLTRAVLNLLAGNTELNWSMRWQVRFFYLLCRLQKHFKLVPRLDYSQSPAPPKPSALASTAAS